MITMAFTMGTTTTAIAQTSGTDKAKLWIEAYYRFQVYMHLKNIEKLMEGRLTKEEATKEACDILKAVFEIRRVQEGPGYEPSRHSHYQTTAMGIVHDVYCKNDAPKS